MFVMKSCHVNRTHLQITDTTLVHWHPHIRYFPNGDATTAATTQNVERAINRQPDYRAKDSYSRSHLKFWKLWKKNLKISDFSKFLPFDIHDGTRTLSTETQIREHFQKARQNWRTSAVRINSKPDKTSTAQTFLHAKCRARGKSPTWLPRGCLV